MPGRSRVYVATSVPVMAAISATGPSPCFVSELPIPCSCNGGSSRELYSTVPPRCCCSVSETLKSKLKSLPSEDAQGKLQPIRRLNAWSFASGARETAARVTSWLARWTTEPLKPSAIAEHDGQPAV